jgi:hypothetical protein
VWLSVDPLAEKYPNISSYVYCADNPVKLVDKDGKIPTPMEGALIADHIYNGKLGDKLLGGWHLDHIYRQKGNTSFRGGLYARTNAKGVTEYAFATAGTYFEKTERGEKSIKEDIKQPFGKSGDMKFSINLAKEISDQLGKKELTFVGHSKGGAEAAGNALATNRNAFLYNPAAINAEAYGLDIKSYTGADRNGMTAFIVKGDAVNCYLGSLLDAEPIDKAVYLPQQSSDPITNHIMASIINALKNYKPEEKHK